MADSRPQIDIEALLKESEATAKKYNRLLILLFVTALCGFLIILFNFPKLSESHKNALIRWPGKIEDLRQMSAVLQVYSAQNRPIVLLAFCWLYIFLQTFAIPGPIFLSILSGTIFGAPLGFMAVCFCATLGASLCFLLSMVIAKNFILRTFPKVVSRFAGLVEQHRHNLFYYMMFLRITPICPNWVINISSPIVGVPYLYFFIATFVGLMPLNFIHLRTGLLLNDVAQYGVDLKVRLVYQQTVLLLFGIGFAALIPTLFTRKMKTQ